MVQQIEFIIYTNIQPLRQKLFLSKVKVIGQCQRLKKCFVNAITWKIIIASLISFRLNSAERSLEPFQLVLKELVSTVHGFNNWWL